MKKTLIAFAVATTTAISANAAVVYNQEGTQVEVGGSVRLFLGKSGNDQRGDLVNDGSRVHIKAKHDLGNGLKAFSGYELRFNENTSESNSFGDPKTKRLYAGFEYENVGALSFGRQFTNADDIVQDNAYYNSGKYIPLTTDADKSIKFRSTEFSGFSFGLDYLFGNPNKNMGTTAEKTHKYGYAANVFYNYELGENHVLDFAATYGMNNFDDSQSSKSLYKTEEWLVHAGYTLDAFNFGVNYGQIREKEKYVGTTQKTRYSLVQASYQIIEPSMAYAQWERLQERDEATLKSLTTNRYLVGVDYKLHENVIAYVQYAHERAKQEKVAEAPTTEKNNEYGLGLRVFF